MKLRNIFAVTLASVAFTACNNDDMSTGIDGNETAYVGLNLTLPAGAFLKPDGGETAESIESAESMETAVKTIKVYQQIGQVAFEVDSLKASDFEWDAEHKTWVSQKAVKVEASPDSTADIYVAVNASRKVDPNGFRNPRPANAYLGTSAEMSDAETGFTMFSEAKVTATTFVDETAAKEGTPATIRLKRAVAKVLLMGSDEGVDPTIDFEDVNQTGTFKANTMKWTIGIDNKKTYLIPLDKIKDPNYDAITAEDFDDLKEEYDNIIPTEYTMPVPKYDADIAVTGYKDNVAHVQYCNENTNETYVYGNTTYLSIRTQFIPNTLQTVTVEDGNLVFTPEGNQAALTFYHLLYHEGLSAGGYFSKEAYEDAVAAGIAADDFTGPYTDGLCYHYVPVRNGIGAEAGKGVFRNNFYIARIKSMLAPGSSEPIDPNIDPDKPVDERSYITVAFTVVPWVNKDMGDLDLK